MSTLLRLSTPRLEKAVARSVKRDPWSGDEQRFSVRELRQALERRGMSDRDIHSLFFNIIGVLEPPACPMSHCKNYGGCGAPMNCSLERIPGRCTILKEFKQRQDAKAEKKAKATAESVAEASQ